MTPKKLFLIDGSALYYRSYFAFIRTPLITSSGENTNASFGVADYLLKILLSEKPDYVAVVFDTSAPTFRHQMYDQYKANRQEMPEEMRAQYPRVCEVIRALDIPILSMEGFEADDIMGTLAKKASQKGIATFLATGDKDMMQLVGGDVLMYSMRPGKNSEIIDAAGVKAEIGLRPDQVVDYLALMGDSSDNVPGVPKVGKKTAQALLEEFDTLANLYDNLDKVPGKAVKASLEENRHLADLSRKLVIIETDVPIEADWEALKRSPVDPGKVIPLFQTLEFTSLITRVSGADLSGAVDVSSFDEKKQDYRLINSEKDLQQLSADLSALDFFVFDSETTGLDAFSSEIVGLSFAWEAGRAVYVPFNGAIPSPKIIDTLRPIFENPAIGKGGQNVKFDALMLHQHGIHLKGITFDTLIAAFLVIPGGRQLNLDALAQSLLGYQMISIENLIGPKGKKQLSMAEVEVEDVSRYACEDADITLQLVKVLSEKLDETETRHLFETVEMPLVSVLLEMEKTGVKLDTAFLAEMSVTLGEDIERLEKEIHEAAGESFNTNSTQQLAGILFEKLEIHKALGKRPPKKTKTGKYSTSESELLKYEAHPLVHQILEYRKLAKLKSTYVDALPQLIAARDGRLHTSFNQTVAATGRLSSHDPNLQNIPIRGERGREIRKAFIPADGDKLILSADYSQVELRIMAHISGDDGLREAFENGEDIHSSTAAAIFGIPMEAVEADHRRKAKEVNFGIIYGISRFGLAGRLGIKADEAEQIILSYFSRYPKVNNYIADTIRQAMADGYVTTMLNRRRYIPDLLSQNQNIRQNAERVAINTPIQGSAADLIKIAMINIQKALEAGQHQAKMILQVHDELVFEVPRAELAAVKELVIREMEGAMDLKVPLKVDCGSGDNWMEAH